MNHGTVAGKSIREAVNDDEYLNGEFVTTVQKRGAAIIAARKLSSALSAASSVCDHIRNWVVSMEGKKYVHSLLSPTSRSSLSLSYSL